MTDADVWTDDGAQAWAALILPASEESDSGLDELEDKLIAAVKRSEVGAWEGHGFDLERKTWEVRFYGPKGDRLVAALMPVLRAATLPRGSRLLVGVGEEEKDRIAL